MATKLGTLTLDLVARISSFTDGMNQASATAEREMRRVENSVVSVDSLIKKLAVTAGAAFSISSVIQVADEYTQMAAQVRNATKDQQEYDTVQKHLLNTANTTYRALKEAQQVYLDIGGALKAYGASTDKALRITDSLSFSFTHNATATDKAKTATDAFMKSVYSGKVTGDSWRAMLSAIPSIVDDMSASLGKSKDEILTMGNAGKFTATQLNDSFDKSREKSEALANAMSNSLADGIQSVKNAFSSMIGEANITYGVTNNMAAGLGVLAENLGTITKLMMVAGAYMAGTYIPVLATTAIGFARNTAEVIRYQLALVSMQASATGASRSLIVLRGVLGGPTGIGLTLAAVAAGYLLMKGNAEKATASIDFQGQKVDDLVIKYRELNTLQRDNENKALADQVEELSLKYRVASSDLFTFMEALPISDDKLATFAKLNSQLSLGKISSDDYYKSVKAVNVLTDDQLDKVRGLVGGYVEGKKKFNEAEVAQKAFATATGQTTAEIKKQAIETANLSSELKELLSTNAEDAGKNNFIATLVGKGIDQKLAELVYAQRKAEGILGTTKRLSSESLKSVAALYESQQKLNTASERQKNIEEAKKKAIEAQGNAMKVNALVASNAAKANYAAFESAKNLPKGLLSAVNMVESPNSNTARSGAGASGPFQFMPKTASAYNVDVSSVSSSAKGASEYLSKLLKMFEGNIENALRAYNWGEGNMQNYLKYGSGLKNGKKGYFADKPMPKETREYSGKVMGYLGGASGVSFTENYSYDDYIKEIEKFSIEREKLDKEMAAKRKEIESGVASEVTRIRSELADKIEEIEKAGFTPEKSAQMKAEYQKRADIDIQIAESAHQDKLSAYSDYMKSEEQMLNDSYARRQRDLKLDLTLTADEYKKASFLLEGERDKELQKSSWRALEVRKAMADQIKALSGNADNIFAKATMAPGDYEKWSLENERSNAQLGLKNQRIGTEQDIMTSNAYSTDDERYEALKQAHQEYREALAAIDVDYYQKQADLQNQTQAASLAGYGAMFGMMGSMLDAYGAKEGSAYRIAFAMQKGFVLSSAIMNAKGAIMSAWNDPSNVTVWQKIASAAAVTVKTNELMSAIQGVALTGMAHDGIDNIPKEGTWLLDKGERVVDSRTNSDLKDYLANGRSSSGGDVHISVQVTDSGVSAQSNQQDQKQLGQMIGNAVRAVIRQEQRQGGLLR